MTVFIRLLEASVDEKAVALGAAVDALRREEAPANNPRRVVFECPSAQFSDVPGSPFAYWVSESIRTLFSSLPALNSQNVLVRLGASTKNDFRFLRLAWEVAEDASAAKHWWPLAKGGQFSPFYSDIHLVISWAENAREIEAELLHKFPYLGTNADFVLHRNDPHLRPGLTWPIKNRFSFKPRALPAGCVFAHVGPSAFVSGDNSEALSALQALMSSATFTTLVRVMAGWNFEVGVIQRTPVPSLSSQDSAFLSQYARRAWSLKRSLDTGNETSHAFLLPLGVNERITGLDENETEAELTRIQQQIDDRAFELYGIGPEDRAVIESSSRAVPDSGDGAEDFTDEESDDEAETEDTGQTAAVLSWLVGVVFGRFDPRLAIGERAVPPEPEPFDPLPSRSPGMWLEGESPKDAPGILVDDGGHAADLAARVKQVAEKVCWEPPGDLRTWLARAFFPLHIKRYSKSRRKAPIYWQLATPSGSYSVWLYLHAFTNDTLFRVQHDYAGPKLLHEEQRLESLRREFGDSPSRTERQRIADQESFVEELRAFLEEIKRIAPLWNPNLDDGVIINFALLWRLVPHCKSWQKELKATWDALCAGEYDWAHLAMHLWPERVIPKCAKDRSLAIVHGLEEVFWVENNEGKWVARQTPTRPIEEIVRERTLPTVRSVLNSLLQAPVAQNSGGRSRSRRARAAGYA